jgi:Putative MetA-pathway of phenol degradation
MRMLLLCRLTLLICCAICSTGVLAAQMPFYTDDPDVTARGVWHFEFFNEYDGLQSAQYPNLNQNTANFKLNYGLPHGLELDLDAPYIAIYRSAEAQTSSGFGDTDMGIKWNFRKAAGVLRAPALAASFYVEVPTGNEREQLGSGLTDYWLNSIAQEPLSDKTRLTVNFGFLFAGNTSTGVVGIDTTRGHVYTGGLSLLHDFTPRLSLGGEVYGGLADNKGLGRDQLQGLVGGQYAIHNGLSLAFGLLGGRYEASPRIGGQMGFEVDFPDVLHRTP